MEEKESSARPSCAREKSVEVEASIAAHLMERYGPLLDAKALAEVLKFPSTEAFERSVARGNLPVKTQKLKHRRGTFALAHEVARYLAEEMKNEGSRDVDKPDRERGA